MENIRLSGKKHRGFYAEVLIKTAIMVPTAEHFDKRKK